MAGSWLDTANTFSRLVTLPGLAREGALRLIEGKRAESAAIQRRERLAPQLEELASRRFSTPSGPDYSSVTGMIDSGYGDYASRMSAAAEAERRGLSSARQRVAGLYNLDAEDPYARAALQFALGDIDARRGAASEATRRGLDDTLASMERTRAGVNPEARAAMMAGIYSDAAGQVGEIISGDQGLSSAGGQDIVGIGAATGDAVDAQQLLSNTSDISADAARGNAQLLLDNLDWLRETTVAQGAGRQGSIQNLAYSAAAEAQRRFLEQEAARRQSEREGLRQAELALIAQETGIDSRLGRDLAEIGLRRTGDLVGLERDRIDAGGNNLNVVQEVRDNLLMLGLNSRDTFVSQVAAMRNDPDLALALYTMGIADDAQARDYYDKNFGGSTSRSIGDRLRSGANKVDGFVRGFGDPNKFWS
jgi:hypothetical protein